MDLSVIIVSFNTKKLTLGCISSVLKNSSGVKLEIIVIDNNSQDGTAHAIKKLSHKNIKVIENDQNLGFSRANNQGIKMAKGKYILLLNSDTKVKKNTLKKLLSFAQQNPNAGVVVPRLLNPDNTIQGSIYKLPTIGRAISQYWLGNDKLLDKYAPPGNEPVMVEAGVMAAFLITPKALKKVGLLNEKYFLYFEDLDYCRKINKAGLKVFYLPESEVIHVHGASGKADWRRLIPSSKIYHGLLGHYIFNFILWSGQKMTRGSKN